MHTMTEIDDKKGASLPLSCLRLLVPPMRLVSAALGKTVQQKVVANYGMLDDFVTMVTDIVPELLNYKQRSLLRLGLRVQLILELCRSEQTADLKTLQPHLDMLKSLTPQENTEGSATKERLSVSNFEGLVQNLIIDGDKRQQFFQDVFPVKFGPSYDEAVQELMGQFLSQLEKLFPTPSLQQVASMLSNISSVLEECVKSVSYPQEMKTLIAYQKNLNNHIQLDDKENLIAGESICAALSLPPVECVLMYQQMESQANIPVDVAESYNREETVESTSQGKGPGIGVEGREKRIKSETKCDDDHSFANDENEPASTEHHVVSLHGDSGNSDSHTVEVQVGYNVEIVAEERRPVADKTSEDEVQGDVQVLFPHKSFHLSTDIEQCTKKEKKDSICNARSYRQDKTLHGSNVAPSPTLYTPEEQALRLYPTATASSGPFRQNQDVPMKTFLIIIPKHQMPRGGHRDSSTTKTCPICGKTYSRASDMRRHHKAHKGECPFQCSRCKKVFQFQYELKRHQLKVCQVIVAQPEKQQDRVSFGDGPVPATEQNDELSSPNTFILIDTEDHNYSPLQSQGTLTLHQEASSSKGDEITKPGKTSKGTQKCEFCGKIFSCPSHLERHVVVHSEQRTHWCFKCDKSYKHISGLKKHSGKCEGSFRVEGGQETSSEIQKPSKEVNNQNLSTDIDSTSDPNTAETSEINKPLQLHCTKCNKSFPDMAKFKTHNLRHKPRQCTMCDESFDGFIDLSQHYLDVHNFSGPFPCAFCDRSYTDLKGLVRHELIHTGDLPFTCTKCPKSFTSSYNLKLHDRSHTKEAPYLCWDCGKRCKSNAALRIHRLCCHSSNEDKHYSCEHCGKTYAIKRSLDAHVAKIHNGVRYPCSHCGKLFRSQNSLIRHDLIHTQERPYSCQECDKSFRSSSELKIHMRYHTGERPFKCQECGKGFVQSYYLTAHKRMHTGEKPYKCPTCDKSFRKAGVLKRHQMTHTGEKPYKCSVCDLTFSRLELLKGHTRKIH